VRRLVQLAHILPLLGVGPAIADGSLSERLGECQFQNPVSVGRLTCYDLALQDVTSSRRAAAGSTVLAVTGTGNQKLDESVVLHDWWQLEWWSGGDYLLVRAVDDEGKALHILGSQLTAGAGRSQRLPAGTYRLTVLASSKWELTFRQWNVFAQ
jgi:hypothetical protein